jgi:hypothetical protein
MADWAKLHTDLLDNPDREELDNDDLAVWSLLLLLTRKEAPTTGIMDGWTPGRLAYRLRQDRAVIDQALAHLTAVGWLTLEDGTLTICHYLDRQYDAPSDRPERVSYRVRKHRDTLVTESAVTPCNDTARDVTSGNALEQTREDQTRIEENRQEPDWPPATLPIGEQQKLTLMDGAGIAQPMAMQFAEKCTLKRVQDVIGYARSSPGLQNPTAYVVSMLRSGQTLPKAPMPRAKSPPKRLPGEPCYDEAELARLRALPPPPRVALPADLF